MGEGQAKALAPLLSHLTHALALTSPPHRATRTAEPAGLTGTTTDPGLREWDHGGYEGISTVEIHRSRPHRDLWLHGVPPAPDGAPGEPPAEAGLRDGNRLRPVGRTRPPGHRRVEHPPVGLVSGNQARGPGDRPARVPG